MSRPLPGAEASAIALRFALGTLSAYSPFHWNECLLRPSVAMTTGTTPSHTAVAPSRVETRRDDAVPHARRALIRSHHLNRAAALAVNVAIYPLGVAIEFVG